MGDIQKSNSEVSYLQKKDCWSLENLPEDEMKLILPFLSKKDLKRLRLVSKRCAKQVILYDKRMQKWHIIEQNNSKVIYETLKKSKSTEYFAVVSVKLCCNKEDESSPKRIIKTLRKQIVELEIYVDEYYFNKICIPNLTKLNVQGNVSIILHNKSIAKTIKCLAITNSERESFCQYDVKDVFPELQSLCLKNCKLKHTWAMSQNLHSLIILEQDHIDIGCLPTLPNLKILMVDYTSIKLIYKCAESLEYLNMIGESFDVLCRMYDDIEEDFILPKLKHLVFGEFCYPQPRFVIRHKATLETLTIQDLDPGCEHELEHQKQENINMIKKWINDFPLLHTLILSAKYRIVDKSGKLRVLDYKMDAVKILKHICQTDYNVMDDGFIKYIFPDHKVYGLGRF